MTKQRRRCPECGSTALKARTTLKPRFRCAACGSVFARTRTERLEVTVSRAEYANGWVNIGGAVTAAELEAVCLARSKQHAIRQLDVKRLEALLVQRHISPAPRTAVVPVRDIPGGRRPSAGQQRIGQGRFRRRLLERFGAVCLISGPQPVESLHAAHVYRFADEPRHDLAGGLLLRADLHALFDAGLIDIDKRLRVIVDPTLATYPEIHRYAGRQLKIAGDDPLRPALCGLLARRQDPTGRLVHRAG